MPTRSPDLHGSVPENSHTTLLLIDVINDLEFEGGQRLVKPGLAMARNLARLKARAKTAGIPSIYVNDNFGRWTSDFRFLVDHCSKENVRGAPIVKMLQPVEGDYFVLKPKHSGFFSSTLELVLKYVGASFFFNDTATTE